MVIFTSICANYLHKARTLAESAKKHISDLIFIVCMLENEMKSNFDCEHFDEVILAKDAWEGNFERFIFKHKLVEASTSVKGQFLKYLLNRFADEKYLLYVDPDSYVYSDFFELRKALDEHPIVLCPHLLMPGNIDMEISSMKHGTFNLGFLAINNSKEAKKFVDWWASRLYLYCYDDIPNGIFTDQRWVDLAPSFYDVKIFKHHGYDFAIWSLLGCDITIRNDEYYVNGDPLRFIHFSGFGATAEDCMNKWLPEGGHHFRELYMTYAKLHDNNNSDGVSKTPWSYGYFSSGEKINDIRSKQNN